MDCWLLIDFEHLGPAKTEFYIPREAVVPIIGKCSNTSMLGTFKDIEAQPECGSSWVTLTFFVDIVMQGREAIAD